MKTAKIGFIGAGNMAGCLIGGLINDGVEPKNITVSDLDSGKLDSFRARGINTTLDNNELVANNQVVVLAVKPQVMKSVIQPLAETAQQKKPLVLSVAAGITSSDIERWLGGDLAVVRCMPNTPALVGTGATGLFANPRVSDEQHELAESILRTAGLTMWVQSEAQLDAVTAVSGSGPAYYFLLMEAMQKAGVAMGLDEEAARLLTLQTALGAAKLALEADDEPAELRAKVTSPGGTTEQAINTFKQAGFEQIVEKAMQAARKRAEELAQQLGAD